MVEEEGYSPSSKASALGEAEAEENRQGEHCIGNLCKIIDWVGELYGLDPPVLRRTLEELEVMHCKLCSRLQL